VAVRQWDSFFTKVEGVYPVTKDWNAAPETKVSVENHP